MTKSATSPEVALFVIEDLWYEERDPKSEEVRKLTEAESLEMCRWLQEFQALPDHILVIVGVSYLDQSLEKLLAGAMIADEKAVAELLQDADGLGTLSTRIKLAHCLGLISFAAARELHLLRRIRNRAAHGSRLVTFSEDPIKSQVASLHEVGMARVVGTGSPRDRFIGSVLTLRLVLATRWQRGRNAVPARISLAELEFMSDTERAELLGKVKEWQAKEKAKAVSSA